MLHSSSKFHTVGYLFKINQKMKVCSIKNICIKISNIYHIELHRNVSTRARRSKEKTISKGLKMSQEKKTDVVLSIMDRPLSFKADMRVTITPVRYY